MNKTIIVGRLTRDPEIKQAGETTVCNFGIAHNDGYGDKQKTHFFECFAFGKTAEFITKHFNKGKMVLVEGSLEFQQWENGEGQKRSTVKIKCQQVHFWGSKESNQTAEKPDSNEHVDNEPDSLPF